ncbi:MAG: MarR family transcriptional regulator [Microbacterium sp.]|uniref:MarR family winged helix-turn-helix transcriptional regulator n=1 Tax=Microbacterium sp. TaxID=51671 RepID=UPI0039E5AA84
MASEQDTPSQWLEGLPYRIWRANQAVHRQVVDAIAGLGVTVTQLGIAVHLDELGHLSASDLARLFGLTPQSVTTALNRLESLGWVSRLPHPVHRRVIWYELTPAGLAGIDEGRRRVAEVNDRVVAAVGADAESFDATLGAIVERFGDARPAGTMWPVPTGSRGSGA